jgi:DNA (cytosine-5)-methyltransferase 1
MSETNRTAAINTALLRTHVDLFAGCGGLALGLKRAGWTGVFAVERDPMAFETLQRNMLLPSSPYSGFSLWPSWLPKKSHSMEGVLKDHTIRRKLSALRGQVSLVSGGPPCQGFSVGGIRDGLDSRNQLVLLMLEFLDLVKPPVVLIENVEGIARAFKSKPGLTRASVADYVVDALREHGYDAAFTVVDASRFGVPQVRKRVLIAGISSALSIGGSLASSLPDALDKIRQGFLSSLGLPLERPVTVGEAIHDLAGKRRVVCPDSPKFESGTYLNPKSPYAMLMRSRIPSTDVPNCHRFSKHGGQISELYISAHETQCPGRLPKSFLMEWGTKKDKKVLLDPNAPASTITTHPDEFIHYAEPRNITVREMARLQSFPDDFRFYGRYTINGPRRRHDVARCCQVGNAVPPLLGQAIGLALLELVNAGVTGEALSSSGGSDFRPAFVQTALFA